MSWRPGQRRAHTTVLTQIREAIAVIIDLPS
jgi:hypothetical protein